MRNYMHKSSDGESRQASIASVKDNDPVLVKNKIIKRLLIKMGK